MADGDISAPTDKLIWNAVAIERPRAVHVAGNVFAFSYEEHDDKGKVASVEIDTSGNIGAAIIDSLTFENEVIQEPDIIHVTGNIFAIAYSGVDIDGFVCTVTVNNDGSIDGSVIDSLEFDTTDCTKPKIFHVAGETYGITYRKGLDGFLVTVGIDAAGEIADAILGSREFEGTNCSWSTPIMAGDNCVAIFYQRDNGPGVVKTWSISNAGVIGAVFIDAVEIDNGVLTQCDAAWLTGNIYTYTYTKSDYFLRLKTLSISAAGAISAVIDSLLIDGTIYCWGEQNILRVSPSIICIAYQGTGDDGYMKTVEIDSAGAITDPVLDSLEFDTSAGDDPMIIHVSASIYALFYRGVGGNGTIITPGIETPTFVKPGHLMMFGIG